MASATQTLQMLWVRGQIRRSAERTGQFLYQAERVAVGSGRANRPLQRFADKFGFRHFGLLCQHFQARVQFFGYAADQRVMPLILEDFTANAMPRSPLGAT
jgi:hypothetical protein